jgi:hypothetical protein
VEALFASYRESLPDFDANRDFMPALWSRIEREKRIDYSFSRWARGFLTAAAALCLMISVALYSTSPVPAAPSPTYVDALAADAPAEPAIFELASLETQ